MDDTRELLDNVQYVTDSRDATRCTSSTRCTCCRASSFNALLKTLEEPPPHVKFLLATTDPQKLPATILSRCLQFNLKRLGVEPIRDQLAHILTEEGRGAPEHAVRLDDRSVADFVRLYFGPSVLERWAGPLVEAWGHGDVEETSRVMLLRLHALRASTWQGVLRGGLGELAEALSDLCEVQLGVGVESVEPRADGGLVVRPGPPAPDIEADAVVVATRAGAAVRILGPLLAPAERDVLGATTYAPSIVLHALLDEPLIDVATRVRVPAAEGLPVVAFAHEAGTPDGRIPEGASVVSLVATPRWSAAHLEAADEVIEKELLAVLDRPHPGASSRVEHTDLRRHREALPLFPVGRYRQLRDLRRVSADRRAAGRRVYVAGDYLADPTLDGAVRSGLRAAAELAADFRRNA